MATLITDLSDPDLDLEPPFDCGADRARPAPTTVANPRRTTWTGYGKDAEDRLPSY